MKKYLVITIIFICSAQTCNHAKFKDALGVNKVYLYTNQANTKCSEKLTHEGEEVIIQGFIHKTNTFQESNRFHVFDSANIDSRRIEVFVTNDSNQIFKKIEKKLKGLNEQDYKTIVVKGVITGKELYTNNKCIRGTFINLSNSENIYIE